MFQTRYIAVSRSSKLYFTMPATLLCLIGAIFTGGLVSATASPARSLRASAQKPHTVAKASAGHEPPAALKLASSTHPAGPDYMTEVHPLLQSHCGQCHLNGSKMGALSLDSRDSILKGGGSGPAVVVGNSKGSLLIKLVTGGDPARVMPMGGQRLSTNEISILSRWIDAGLTFNGGPAAPAFRDAPLKPRAVTLPPGSAMNPIDRLLAPYFRAHGFHTTALVSDRVFARRAYLDLIGLLPSPEALTAFEADRGPNKRARLAQFLLQNRQEYATHWLTFWNDALRNDYAGTGYIDGGRKQITRWLYQALYQNMPYDEFVRELINPAPESDGFIRGIVWRGTVNASQTPPMQAAQNISQVFLGINLKCASCHDSFISNWKLADSYGLAGVYADKPLETVRCDVPTGKIAAPRFLYPQLGAIDASAPREKRLAELAAAITSRADGRLARTIVNRLWARLMGRGLVEPVDVMDNLPWNQDLLDWLADDLSSHGYDLKRTLFLIATSQAYSLPSMQVTTERTKNFTFAGPVVKRMTAEQLVDALATMTGVWPRKADADTGLEQGKLLAHWIWDDSHASQATPGARVYFRKTLQLTALPTRAPAVLTCDNELTLYVNGKQVAASSDWQKPLVVDLQPYLTLGDNAIAILGVNWPDPVTGKGRDVANGPNPAGLFFDARLYLPPAPPGSVQTAAMKAPDANPRMIEIGSDGTWLCSSAAADGWEKPGFTSDTWKPAADLGGANAAPWAAEGMLAASMPGASTEHVRAALVKSDDLMSALGRPNREQVVTSRPAATTTLEALEMTNGRILAGRIHEGALRWMGANSTSEIVNGIFRQALGRSPTTQELHTGLQIVGAPATADGVEDLMWAVVMLPEFQLIR